MKNIQFDTHSCAGQEQCKSKRENPDVKARGSLFVGLAQQCTEPGAGCGKQTAEQTGEQDQQYRLYSAEQPADFSGQDTLILLIQPKSHTDPERKSAQESSTRRADWLRPNDAGA